MGEMEIGQPLFCREATVPTSQPSSHLGTQRTHFSHAALAVHTPWEDAQHQPTYHPAPCRRNDSDLTTSKEGSPCPKPALAFKPTNLYCHKYQHSGCTASA